MTILLIEQNAKLALHGNGEISQRGYVMESGEITLTGERRKLLKRPQGARRLSRRIALMQDVSTEQFVTKALNMVGLESGKKLYAELLGIIEGGTLKASGINMAKAEGRCQLPGTKEEAWRASGNEPGWVLAAGGQMVSFKQFEKPGINLPYTPFKREGKLALFEGATEAGKLSFAWKTLYAATRWQMQCSAGPPPSLPMARPTKAAPGSADFKEGTLF
jgi:hypothetical protein